MSTASSVHQPSYLVGSGANFSEVKQLKHKAYHLLSFRAKSMSSTSMIWYLAHGQLI